MELFKASLFLCLSLLMSDASIRIEHKLNACDLAQNSIDFLRPINNLDHFDLYALIIIESRWDDKAISTSGACGLTQVIPKYSNYSCEDLLDSNISINAGTEALQYWLDKTDNDKRYALCSYGWGYSCVAAKKRREKHPGLRYADRVLSVSNRLRLRYEKYEKHFNDFIYNLIVKITKIDFKNNDF